jgi:DsbC/DsbD-like thiol-disulfide interchange protein
MKRDSQPVLKVSAESRCRWSKELYLADLRKASNYRTLGRRKRSVRVGFIDFSLNFTETMPFAEREIGGKCDVEGPVMRKSAVTMIVTIAFLMLGLESAWAQDASSQVSPPLVQASLLSNVSVVKPGEPFTVGVLLKIKPGWHVYWINPGDAGLPTRVHWTLPAGYTASELRFPVPQHIDQPGGIVIYGYTDQVMLTSTIMPPTQSNSSESTAIPISANVDWLCCSEACVPGKAKLNLQLMTGEKSVPDNKDVFEQWQDRLPIIAAAQAPPLVLSDSSPRTQIVTTRKIADAKAIIPGAADGLILTVGAPQATALGTTIPVTAQVLKGQTVTAKSVPILLTWADSDGGARLGEQITVPIVSGR